MSATATAAAPAAAATEAPAPKPGRKKLLLIVGAALLALLLVGGGVAFWLMKSKPAAEEDADEPAAAAAHATAAKADGKKSPPTFVPLDPFTVNLADKEGERFAQIAVTFELEDSHFGDQIKSYMPAIRHNILMTLAQKTAAELLTREGKELLARQVRRDALRPMGIEVADEADPADAAAAAAKKKAKKKPVTLPIRSVQFASFIIQ